MNISEDRPSNIPFKAGDIARIAGTAAGSPAHPGRHRHRHPYRAAQLHEPYVAVTVKLPAGTVPPASRPRTSDTSQTASHKRKNKPCTHQTCGGEPRQPRSHAR